MDKVSSNFGSLTTVTNPSYASDILDMFRDMARNKFAQSKISPEDVDARVKSIINSGKLYLISVGGANYGILPPVDKLKVLQYYISRLSGSNLMSNKEDALKWAFKDLPNAYISTPQAGLQVLREEESRVKSELAASNPATNPSQTAQNQGSDSDDGSGLGSTGLVKSLIYASQLLFQAGLLNKSDISTINNDPYGAGMNLISNAISRGFESKSQMQQEAAEMAQEIISSIKQQIAPGKAGATANGAPPSGPAAASAGAEGGAAAPAPVVGGAGATGRSPSGGGFLSLIGQGLQAIIDMLKGMPNSPKAADQILVEMALATEPKYWFPNGQVAENGFYGPYMAPDGKYWAEVDYSGQANQFVFSGRYTVIPNDAVKAIQQAAAQGG